MDVDKRIGLLRSQSGSTESAYEKAYCDPLPKWMEPVAIKMLAWFKSRIWLYPEAAKWSEVQNPENWNLGPGSSDGTLRSTEHISGNTCGNGESEKRVVKSETVVFKCPVCEARKKRQRDSEVFYQKVSKVIERIREQ